MKKQLHLFVLLFFSISAHSQELGYRTLDAGAGYLYTPEGPVINLHFALNARERHSFVFGGGYNKLNRQSTSKHASETGNGWGGFLGYRYHFSVMPKRFFIGVRAGIRSMNVSWATTESAGTSNLLVLQPGLETGYTFLINDMFFITPHIIASLQKKLAEKGENVSFGKDFLPMAGISCGWRF